MTNLLNSERCVELAIANHLDHTARLITTGQHREIYEVPSRDRSETHEVVYVYRSNAIYCDCKAAQNGQNCCHAGAVIWYLDSRAEAYAQAKRITRVA